MKLLPCKTNSQRRHKPCHLSTWGCPNGANQAEDRGESALRASSARPGRSPEGLAGADAAPCRLRLVLASPETNGKNPIWLDMVLQNYIKPALRRLGITKKVGWHTWRHSLATLLASKGENVKVTQELLRHSNAQITLDLYQEADTAAKRAAQGHTKPLFLVQKAS